MRCVAVLRALTLVLVAVCQVGGVSSSGHSGHTVNWDLIADCVNQASRAHRSPRGCRARHEQFTAMHRSSATDPATPATDRGLSLATTDRVMALAARHSDRSPAKGHKVTWLSFILWREFIRIFL